MNSTQKKADPLEANQRDGGDVGTALQSNITPDYTTPHPACQSAFGNLETGNPAHTLDGGDLVQRLAQTRRAIDLAEAEENEPAAAVLTAHYRELERQRRAALLRQAAELAKGAAHE